MTCDSKVPEENPALAGLLAIMRHQSLSGGGGEFVLRIPTSIFSSPLRFAETEHKIYGEWMSRRCLRRNLPFLPGPSQFSLKYWVN
jgi:hypothetical protein